MRKKPFFTAVPRCGRGTGSIRPASLAGSDVLGPENFVGDHIDFFDLKNLPRLLCIAGAIFRTSFDTACSTIILFFGVDGDLDVVADANLSYAGSKIARRITPWVPPWIFQILFPCSEFPLKVKLQTADASPRGPSSCNKRPLRQRLFEITQFTREAVVAWIKEAGLRSEDYLFQAASINRFT